MQDLNRRDFLGAGLGAIIGVPARGHRLAAAASARDAVA